MHLGNKLDKQMISAGEDGEWLALPAVSSDWRRFVGEPVVNADVVVRTVLRLQIDVVVAVQIKVLKVQANSIIWTP